MKSVSKRTAFVVVCIAGIWVLYQLFIRQYLTMAVLKMHKEFLFDQVRNNYLRSVLLYIIMYMGATALSIPGSALFSIAGGFLFKLFPGIIYVCFSALTGALIAFIAIRYFLGSYVQLKYHEQLRALNALLAQHGVRTLLILRLMPIIPFFLVTLLAALTKISLGTFIWTTLVGMLPASLVFTFFGSQLEKIQSFKDIFSLYSIIAIFLVLLVFFVPLLLNGKSLSEKKQ